MQVTDVVELSKARSKIYIDREFAFVLYKGELRQYGIAPGQEFAPEDYEEIMNVLLPKRAKLRAMNLLTKRTYTTAQLRRKLEEGFYPEGVIEQALEYVASFHYTDDLRYATDFIEYRRSTMGRRRIEQELYRKGISPQTVQQAWLQCEETDGEEDESAVIKQLLHKKGYCAECADMNEKRRMFAFLVRKGFGTEQISKVLHNYSEDA